MELHQGTLTSQALNKKYNKKCETLLREIEILYSINWFNKLTKYPFEELNEIWNDVLIYQFHDILPGSSIEMVYKEVKKGIY